MCYALDVCPSPFPPACRGINIYEEDPTTLTDEAGPSAQQEPPTQTQQAANDSVDTDLANLAVVVDELQGSTAGDATSRDYVSLAVAFASEMQRRPATTESETSRRS